MEKKIIIIGAGAGRDNTILIEALMMENPTKNIVLLTPNETKEQGIQLKDIAKTPTFSITPSPMMGIKDDDLFHIYKSGGELRRERRKAEKKKKKV